MKTKKILIISHHFWPETFLINKIALKIKKFNRKVTVITGLPNYPKGEIFKNYNKIKSIKYENYKGLKIVRFPILPRNSGSFFDLVFNYLSYLISGIYYLRNLNLNGVFDHIFIYSTSPITTALLGIYLKKKYKKKITLWIQDLWPESIESTGYIKNKFFLYLISLIVKYIYKQSDNLVAQSKGFKKNIRKYSNKKVKIVENSHFILENKRNKIPNKINYLLQSKFCVTFAGNIGKAQSITTILEACRNIESYKNIHVILIGGGSEVKNVKNLIKKHNINNISIFGPYSSELAFKILKKSKASLLSLKKNNIFSMTIPNKFQTYLCAGKPILVSANGEVSKLTKINKVGLTSPAENFLKLSKNIIKLYKMSSNETKKIKYNCLKYYKNSFDINKQTKKLLNIFEL